MVKIIFQNIEFLRCGGEGGLRQKNLPSILYTGWIVNYPLGLYQFPTRPNRFTFPFEATKQQFADFRYLPVNHLKAYITYA
jgi:hypothetical protein